MMQPEPIMMGPAIAKMVALGCTTVPGPIVMSPFSSTSWQTTALEWIVNLSRLQITASPLGACNYEYN